MKAFKRITVAILTVVIMVSMASCGQDITWVAQKGDTTIPVGVYLYYLENQSSVAKQDKVADKTVPVLKQEIDGQPAEAWIIDQAKRDIKRIYAVDEWMNELNIKVPEDEENEARNSISQYWDQYYKLVFEPMGISDTSVIIASTLESAKESAIFKAIYDKDGEDSISKSDILDYYEKNYYNISKISVPLFDSETGSVLDDEQIETIKKELEKYVAELKDGKRSFADIKKAYDETISVGQEEQQDTAQDADNVNATSSAAASKDEVADAIRKIAAMNVLENLDIYVDPENITSENETVRAMKDGDIQIVQSDSEIYVCIKNDINTAKEAFYDNDDNRMEVSHKLKDDEFEEAINKRIDALEGVVFNEAVLKRYRPKSPEVDSAAPESESDGSSEESNE